MSSLGFKGKKVFVYGLGKSGLAIAASLYADGAEVYVYDKQPLDTLLENQAVQKILDKPTVFFADGGHVDFSEFSAFFKSPGIDTHDEVVVKATQAGLTISGDVDLLYKREPNATFIGITGTNGKSTTTALVGHILEKSGLKVATGGNLGTAMLNLPQNQDFYVLELSSYQLETMHEMEIDRAVLLNLTPDHLARHGDMQGYLDVKRKIFSKQAGVHVLGVDNEILKNITSAAEGHFVTVSVEGVDANIQVQEDGTMLDAGEAVLNMNSFSHLPGRHNWQNIASAYGVVKGLVSMENFKKAVLSFKNLPHRMEKVAQYKNISFYNDSKATNPESAIRALESFEHIFWICGGQMKDEGMKPCLAHIQNVECAFVIGKETTPVIEELDGHLPLVDCSTMEEAVYKAWKRIEINGLEKASVLLSPACASWDQYDSFEHRGDCFVSLCHELVSRLQVDES